MFIFPFDYMISSRESSYKYTKKLVLLLQLQLFYLPLFSLNKATYIFSNLPFPLIITKLDLSNHHFPALFPPTVSLGMTFCQ